MEKDRLILKRNSGERSKKVRQKLPTTSVVNEAKVYRRENHKETILQLLLNDDLMSSDGVSVHPIVGMGGVGKATLAQLLYNDVKVKNHFHLEAWVYLFQDFDVFRITKTMLQSISTEDVHDNDLNLLQVKLKEKLLDDI